MKYSDSCTEVGRVHYIKLLLYGTMTFCIMALIFFFSSQSGAKSQQLSDTLLKYIKTIIEILPDISGKGVSHDIRKYAHVLEFMALGVSSTLFFHELMTKRRENSISVLLISILFCVLYACSDELHQLYVPGRSARFVDVFFDSAGAAVGSAASCLIFCLKNNSAVKRRDN